MGNKSVQYYKKSTGLWQQFPTSAFVIEDITLSDNSIADTFFSVKDGDDNYYTIAVYPSDSGTKYMRIIKVDKNGNKTISTATADNYVRNYQYNPVLSRDGKTLFFCSGNADGGSTNIYSVDVENLATTFTIDVVISTNATYPRFAIYQDRYIWTSVDNVISMYDYSTKELIASNTNPISYNAASISITTDNILYSLSKHGLDGYGLDKYTFSGDSAIAIINISYNTMGFAKQLLIDKWGDLIILTNSGASSSIYKYSTAGVWIDTLDETFMADYGICAYNLHTDSDGIYGWSNLIATYRIPPNATTGKGQLFNRTVTKTRNSGEVNYESDTLGYNISENGSVGC